MQHPPCFFTISNRLLLGGNCVKEKKYLDFLGGLVLLMLSVIIIIASVLMHIKSGEVFYLSPGLMPMILGIALLFCSLFYFAESLKDGGFSARICETREWFHAVVSDKTTHSMAVGVIIGGAFSSIITSLVDDILSPILGIFGGLNFDELSLNIMGDVTLKYGKFLTAVINFLIMALVIFCLVKAMNALSSKMVHNKEAAPAAPTTKICPFCKSEIPIGATKCAHCTSELTEDAGSVSNEAAAAGE